MIAIDKRQGLIAQRPRALSHTEVISRKDDAFRRARSHINAAIEAPTTVEYRAAMRALFRAHADYEAWATVEASLND